MNRSNRAWTMLAVVLPVASLLSCGGGGGGGGSGPSCPGGQSTSSGLIGLCYRTTLTTSQKAAFEAAVARLNAVIAASTLSTVDVNEKCDDGSMVAPTVNRTIDGLLILVNVKDMGSGGVLAMSGPCIIRKISRLPIASVMEMNTVYLSQLSDANLRKTVLHEMTHALGFGTLWDQYTPSFLDTTTHEYTGAAALAAAKADNSAPAAWTTVPVEDCVSHPSGSCGSGTIDSHWRWATFDNELMTGWITDGDQPFSATTLASLQDLGYTVDLTKADAYTIPLPAAALLPGAAPAQGIWLGDDAWHGTPVEVPEP